jgi:hypothetical protein
MPLSISGLLSSRETDIGRRALTRRWKKACINLFITYFNIELKRTKLTSHRYQSYGYVLVTTYFIRENQFLLPKQQHIFSRWTTTFSKRQCIDSWAEVTSCGARAAWYRVIRVLPRYLPMSWYRCDTFGVYVWENLTLLFINMW